MISLLLGNECLNKYKMSFNLIQLMYFIANTGCIIFVWSSTSCLRRPGAECTGPFVIRLASQQKEGTIRIRQCYAYQQSTMTSCMHQCQADVCCRAFGLDAAGTCVTFNMATERLHFVKETPSTVQLGCLEGNHFRYIIPLCRWPSWLSTDLYCYAIAAVSDTGGREFKLGDNGQVVHIKIRINCLGIKYDCNI